MKRSLSKPLLFIVVVCILVAAGILFYSCQSIAIQKLQLVSPDNSPLTEEVNVELNQDASVFVRYWKKGTGQHFRTVNTKKGRSHSIRLYLLEPNTTYQYEVVIDLPVNVSSETFSFQTRKQSPWMVHNWVKEENPHDASALGGGLVMLCNARLPGYIAMIDGKGVIKWYWQADDIGVRAATITPRNTILAMLRPPMKDVIDDTPKEEADSLNAVEKPIRRGAMGFAGATAIAEIGLDGKQRWRFDIDSVTHGEYKLLHHDVRMDNNGHIVTLVRNSRLADLSRFGGNAADTIVGDGILVMDTTGKKIWEWNCWDHWDISHDSIIKQFAYDRFHMNSLSFDTDGNYLVSVAIEDQIWKINAHTGEIMWKFGKGGNFKLDSARDFSFQHSAYINSRGELMVFDNSLWRKESGGVSFDLDTVRWIATPRIRAVLPRSKYTSRMGNAFLLPNNNILQTSSKTGSVMVTDINGKILWELNCYFVPYRAEFVPPDIWDNYFTRE